MHTGKRFFTLTVCLLLLVLTLAACGAEVTQTLRETPDRAIETSGDMTDAPTAQEPQLVSHGSASAAAEAQSLENNLTALYEQVNLSVVSIIVPSGASGSGFVYDESGHIVTNHHVVEGTQRQEIIFANGDRAWARPVSSDVDSDLAVLEVEHLPDGIAPLPLAEAGTVRVGQLATAIGSPFGEQGSMSLGIVSGVERSLPSQREGLGGSTYSLPQVIQTDAPINPGNSGGPLLNLHGEVIGVNVAIASRTGMSAGVGFAIPVEAVRQVVPSLIQEGDFAYPYMGASFAGEITLEAQKRFGLPQTQGAYVVAVAPGSPAAEAELVAANPQSGKGGDLIVRIDDQPVHTFADLNSYLIFQTEVGQTVDLTVLRDGERQVIPLTLGKRS